jgi:hypothetical protein
VAGLRQKALLVLAMLALLVASLAGIADAATQPDSIKGKGEDGFGRPFKFSAKSVKGDGTVSNPAKGKFSIKDSSGEFAQGKVQCLEANVEKTGGTVANFVGTVTKTNAPSLIKGEFYDANAFDSGLSQGKEDRFDSSFTKTAQTCHPSTVNDSHGDFILKGNIVVHATTP